MTTAATTKRISKSRTVVAFMFTSLRSRRRAICGIVAMEQVTILVSSNDKQFVLIMKLFGNNLSSLYKLILIEYDLNSFKVPMATRFTVVTI